MPPLSRAELLIISSRIFLKFIGFLLILFLKVPASWLVIYLIVVIATEGLEIAVFYYSRKYPYFKNSYYLVLSFINSLLVLYFIHVTNLTFTDFYVVGFLIVLASTIQGGFLSGFISGLTMASFYSIFLWREDAQPIYYIRSLTFLVLGILFTVLMRVVSTAVEEKEAIAEKYETEINRLKDEFVAVASHNLLSPLTSLKGYLSILTSRRRFSSKERKFYLKRAWASSDRLEEIVNELISVSTLEKPGKVLFLAYTDFGELINPIIEDYKLLASEKEIAISLSMPGKKLPKVLVDPRRIRQAISNLLSNAVKFNKRGGKVLVQIERKGGKLRIRVQDTGIGIPKNKMSNLFQKFTHAHSYLEGVRAEGTGLGLYITKLIVTAHGGNIEAESEEKKGSTFTITLPLRTR